MARTDITISQARRIVRQYVRDEGNDSSRYTDTMIDDGIATVLSQVALDLRLFKRVDDTTLTTGTAEVDLTDMIDNGFDPFRILQAYLDTSDDVTAPQRHEPLAVVDFAEYIAQSRYPRSGEPSILAFEDPASAFVYPTPDKDYILKVRWFAPLLNWIHGSQLQAEALSTLNGTAISRIDLVSPGGRYASAPTVTIDTSFGSGGTATAVLDNNGQVQSITVTASGSYTSAPTVTFIGNYDWIIPMPSDALYRVLPYVSSVLQFNDPSQMFAGEAYKRLLDTIKKISQIGSLGSKTVQMSRLP